MLLEKTYGTQDTYVCLNNSSLNAALISYMFTQGAPALVFA